MESTQFHFLKNALNLENVEFRPRDELQNEIKVFNQLPKYVACVLFLQFHILLFGLVPPPGHLSSVRCVVNRSSLCVSEGSIVRLCECQKCHYLFLLAQ